MKWLNAAGELLAHQARHSVCGIDVTNDTVLLASRGRHEFRICFICTCTHLGYRQQP